MKRIMLILIAALLYFFSEAQKFTNYTNTNYVSSIAIDVNGNKWIGTNGGVLKFDGAKWTKYTTADGLVDNRVTTIAIDSIGNIWFGTNDGVSKFDGAIWMNYTTGNGLADNWVIDIIIDAQGNLWLGTEESVNVRWH